MVFCEIISDFERDCLHLGAFMHFKKIVLQISAENACRIRILASDSDLEDPNLVRTITRNVFESQFRG